MKAIVCEELAPADRLVLREDFPAPKTGKNDVKIAVHACGLNFPDTLIIEGKYQFKAMPPFVPGAEMAGEIIEVGEKVTHLQVGQRVMTVATHGGFAEEAVIPAMGALPIPEGMPYEQAAAFPMAYGTTMYALKQRAGLLQGETLLVLGAAGGVGMAAVQLGKLMGARVIAAASSDEKLAVCRQAGADEIVNYSEGELKTAVKKLTGGKGADVIYDPVGGDLFQQSLSCINWNGRILVIGFASGTIPEAAVNRCLLKNCAIVGVFWGASMVREPQENMQNFALCGKWYAEGKLVPHVSATYPLADAPRAMQDMLSRSIKGKAVIRVRD